MTPTLTMMKDYLWWIIKKTRVLNVDREFKKTEEIHSKFFLDVFVNLLSCFRIEYYVILELYNTEIDLLYFDNSILFISIFRNVVFDGNDTPRSSSSKRDLESRRVEEFVLYVNSTIKSVNQY